MVLTDAEATARLLAAGAVLIDGRSGSGKTEFARALLAGLRAAGRAPRLLQVEDLYPGWDGLAAGSAAVAGALRTGRYRRYDWHRGAFDPAPVMIGPAGPPLVVEGCGALTAGNLAAARERAGGAEVVGVWLECAETVRRERAIARDGDAYAPHWERWAAQEAAHDAVHRPRELADLVLAG